MTVQPAEPREAAPRPPESLDDLTVDYAAVLRTLKLDGRDPKAQAVVLVCQRYGLDPVLKHVVLVEGNIYVTRDGLLHVAHSSGQFDGIEVVDDPKLVDGEWIAKVSVYRKDWTRPATYVGRYANTGGNAKYRPEMAVKVAEVAALRRAFDVALATLEEREAADLPRERPASDLGAALAARREQTAEPVETPAAEEWPDVAQPPVDAELLEETTGEVAP